MNDFSLMVSREIDHAEWRWVFVCSIALLVLITIPFVWAYGVGGSEARFMGVLVNPIDGASYQAKMRLGVEGSWLFYLPYTPELHDGVFLFTFYLAMGHLARILSLPVITVFHGVRLVGAVLMFFAIYRFVADWTSSVEQRRLAWSLAVLGAGFGWVALAFGHTTPDILSVPEAFPLQAAYANAHFPWAIAAAMLVAHVLVIKCAADEDAVPALDIETVGLAAASVFLATTSPFVLLPIGIGFGAMLAWLIWQRRELPRRELAWGLVVLIFVFPFAAYSAWVMVVGNPAIAAWMEQNVTPSPPVWDYLIAFGPLLMLALPGIWASRRKMEAVDIFLLSWLVGGALLLYAPFSLQRRFTMGLIMPLAVYAGRGLWRVIIPKITERRRGLVVALTFALFMPTLVIALVGPMFASLDMKQKDGGLYFLGRSELEAVKWLERNARGAVVLASPELSMYLPAYGLRVVYGHPMETIRAEERKQAVAAFYEGTDCTVVQDEPVQYVVVGPRERKLAQGSMCPVRGEEVYHSPDGGEVVIYAALGY